MPSIFIGSPCVCSTKLNDNGRLDSTLLEKEGREENGKRVELKKEREDEGRRGKRKGKEGVPPTS